jgi:DNA primase
MEEARAGDELRGRCPIRGVEGFLDSMKVTKAGHACVALMGCSMPEQQEAQLVEHFQRVVIMPDGDDAAERRRRE